MAIKNKGFVAAAASEDFSKADIWQEINSNFIEVELVDKFLDSQELKKPSRSSKECLYEEGPHFRGSGENEITEITTFL